MLLKTQPLGHNTCHGRQPQNHQIPRPAVSNILQASNAMFDLIFKDYPAKMSPDVAEGTYNHRPTGNHDKRTGYDWIIFCKLLLRGLWKNIKKKETHMSCHMYCKNQHTIASNITCYLLAFFALQSQETQTLDHVKEAPSNDSQSSRSAAGYHCLANLEIVNIQQTSLGLRRFFLHNLPTRIAVWGRPWADNEGIWRGRTLAIHWFRRLWGNYMDFKLGTESCPFHWWHKATIAYLWWQTSSQDYASLFVPDAPEIRRAPTEAAATRSATGCLRWKVKGFSTHPDWGWAGLSNVQTKNMEEHTKACKSLRTSFHGRSVLFMFLVDGQTNFTECSNCSVMLYHCFPPSHLIQLKHPTWSLSVALVTRQFCQCHCQRRCPAKRMIRSQCTLTYHFDEIPK